MRVIIISFVSSFCSYEEENFVRLTVSKNQQRKARATSGQDTLNSLLHFGDYGLNDDAGKKQVHTLYFLHFTVLFLYSRYEIEILEKVKVGSVATRNRSRKALVVGQRRNDKHSVITVFICFVTVLVVAIV
jgi:hypothetical protein